MADAYWSSVASLLHFNAADGTTIFSDQKGRTWTARGGAEIDTAQSKFGGSSLYLNGTDAAIDSPNGADIYISGGTFTAECWFRETATATAAQIFGQHSVSGEVDSSWILYSDSGTLSCAVYSGASTFVATASSSHSLDVWHHVAAVLSGGTLTLYLDGVSVGSVGSVTTPNENGVLRIGATGTTGTSLLYYFSGWVDEARLTIGVARYTGTFTPSASEFEEGSDGAIAGDVPLIAGDFVGLLVPTGELAGDLVGITGSLGGESGAIGAMDGGLPSIAGDFPGGQGFFAALAGDIPGIGGEFAGLAAQSGVLAGDLPLIAGEFIGGYSVAGAAAGDLPLIAGVFSGFTAVASTLDGTLPLIAGSFVGGMATVGAMAGDLPSIGGAFNDGPVGVFGGGISLHTGDLPGYVGTAASGRWLYLHTVPPAQVYAVDSIRGRLNPYLPAHRIDWAASDVRAEVGRTNDSWSAELVGASADLRNRLALQSPYGIRVDLYDGGEIVRSGVSFGVGYLDRALTLDVQSDVWTRDIPMRTSADLGTFRDVDTLPIRYGRNMPGKLISINQARTLWLWADHASLAIRSVTIDGQPTDGWSWRNDTDANGRAITVVQTVDQIDENADMVAVGDGALDAVTGALLVNPADIARDLCARGGLAVDRGDFAAYRAECLARNLELSGTVEGGSLQSVMTRIAESTHSAFARQLAGYLRLLPLSATASATIAPDSVLRADLEGDIATRLRVRYGVEENGPRRSIEVRATAIERQHGIKSRDVELPMIRDDRSAVDVAGRMLAQLSRPAYRIQCKRQLREWAPGEVASVSVLALGISGDAMVQSSQIGERSSTPTLLLHVGTAPTISLVTVAQAYTPEAYAGATVATQGTNRIITITDDTGRPIAGAACTLDGSMTRISDSAGRVSFPVSAMPPGAHTIDVIATGYSPFRLTVVI